MNGHFGSTSFGASQAIAKSYFNTSSGGSQGGTFDAATTQHTAIIQVFDDKIAKVKKTGTTEVSAGQLADHNQKLTDLEAHSAKVGSAREIAAKVEDETNDYSAYAIGYVWLESMATTEFVMIKTYTELTAMWDDHDTAESDIGNVWVQFGFDNVNLTVGRLGTSCSDFEGYFNIGVADVHEGGGDVLQIQLTALWSTALPLSLVLKMQMISMEQPTV